MAGNSACGGVGMAHSGSGGMSIANNREARGGGQQFYVEA